MVQYLAYEVCLEGYFSNVKKNTKQWFEWCYQNNVTSFALLTLPDKDKCCLFGNNVLIQYLGSDGTFIVSGIASTDIPEGEGLTSGNYLRFVDCPLIVQARGHCLARWVAEEHGILSFEQGMVSICPCKRDRETQQCQANDCYLRPAAHSRVSR